MAALNLGYPAMYAEGLAVSRKLGTWLLHELRAAENLEHFIGYMLYRIEDFKRRKCRATAAGETDRARQISARAAAWSRACRWVQRLRKSDYVAVATRMIEDTERHPEHSGIPYVAEAEADGLCDEDRRRKLEETPRRRCGRPRTRQLKTANLMPCRTCDGTGMVRAS